MAVFGGSWLYKDTEIDVWLDPNRYRIMIWSRSARHPEIFSTKIKRLHDKDKRRGLKRAKEWVDRMSQDKGVTMEPGRELDKLVAEAIGWTDVQDGAFTPYGQDVCGTSPDRQGGWDGFGRKPVPLFSTKWADAGQAWEWLEKNNPWYPCWLTLERSKYGKPSVGISCNDGGREIEGESYPHVIALAVVESTKIKETLT